MAARTRLAKPAAAAVASAATAADDTTSSAAEPAAAEAAPAAAITALPPSLTGTVAQAPTRARGANNAVPAPPGLTRRGGQETAEQQQGEGPRVEGGRGEGQGRAALFVPAGFFCPQLSA